MHIHDPNNPDSRKLGRPRFDIDIDRVKQLAEMSCSNREIADDIGCDESTFRARLTKGSSTYDEALEKVVRQARSRRCIKLRSQQFKILDLAIAQGDLKVASSQSQFLGKQYLEQGDNVRVTGKEGGPIEVVVSSLAEKLAGLTAAAEAVAAPIEPEP